MNHDVQFECESATFDLSLRNPFQIERLSWPLKLYRLGYKAYRTRFERNYFRLPFRYMYRVSRRLISSKAGVMKVKVCQALYELRFDGGNLQYHSLYLPQHQPIYEPEVTGLMRLLAPRIRTFWDVGANWGHHTLAMLADDRFTGSIHAFEPCVQIAEELRRHLEAVRCTDRAAVHQYGLYSRETGARLEVPDQIHSGLSRTIPDDTGQEIMLKVGDCVDAKPPGLIKLDVEGSEAEALQGCVGLIAAKRPIIIVELWRDALSSEQVLATLKLLGYRLFLPSWLSIADGTSRDGFHWCAGSLQIKTLVLPLSDEKINCLALPCEMSLDDLIQKQS